MLDQCTKIFDTADYPMNSRYTKIFAGRILEIKNNTITLSISNCHRNYNIINSLVPFYYIETHSSIIVFPYIHKKNHFLKSFIPSMDSAFIENKKQKIYKAYNDNYAIAAIPSTGFFSAKWLPIQNTVRIKYFITSPLTSVPAKYRPIVEYITGENFSIDSTIRNYRHQPKDAFKDSKKLKNFMFKNKVTLKLPK